jgi:hypothetical protein
MPKDFHVHTGSQLKHLFPYMFDKPNLGFDFFRGWMPIIVQVCVEIDSLLGDSRNLFCFNQIKEKYGTLRLYYYFGDSSSVQNIFQDSSKSQLYFEGQARPPVTTDLRIALRTLVTRAQDQTQDVCMVCSAAATLESYDRTWLTLCQDHHPNKIRNPGDIRWESLWAMARAEDPSSGVK